MHVSHRKAKWVRCDSACKLRRKSRNLTLAGYNDVVKGDQIIRGPMKAMIPEKGSDGETHAFKLADSRPHPRMAPALEQTRHEGLVFLSRWTRLRLMATKCRGVHSFCFFQIKTDGLEPYAGEEIENLVCEIQTMRRQHCDGVEREPMFFQEIQSSHDARMGRPISTIPAMMIMDHCRSIDTQSYENLFPRKKTAPGLVDERAIGLNGLAKPDAAGIALMNDPGRVLEKFQPHSEWLARMPENPDGISGRAA